MSSPLTTRAASMTLITPGQSSLIWSTHSSWTSRSHDQRSWKRAPAASESGVA